MQTIRKPRVFLSHSKKDVDFIRRLESDLRACQCETWIDEVEIRHGKPWLDEIFAAGIPSCELLLCYVTENSIDSSMVRQEIDARLLERFQNDRVTLLVYLASDDLRPRLRLDIQRLQAPVLNEINYADMLPRIVSEVWRSYAELTASTAAQSERVKRLEAELRIKELESLAARSIFSAREDAEFLAIWSALDRQLDISVAIIEKSKSTLGSLSGFDDELQGQPGKTITGTFVLHVGNIFRATIATQKFQPAKHPIYLAIEREVLLQMSLLSEDYGVKVELPVDFEAELLRYGLVDRQSVPPQPNSNPIYARMRSDFRVVFSEKFDRFLFWLDQKYGKYDLRTKVISSP